MRILSVLLCLSIFIKISAEDASSTDDLLNVAAIEGLPSSIVQGSVCAITGAYVDNSLDLVLEGPEKLVLERSYCSHRINANLGTSWSINHVDTITSQVFKTDDGKKLKKFNVRQPSGSILQYNKTYKHQNQPINFIPKLILPIGLTNTRQYEISGRTNLKNRKVVMTLNSTPACHITSGDGEHKFFRYFKKNDEAFLCEYMKLSCNGIQTLYELDSSSNYEGIKIVAPDGQQFSEVEVEKSVGHLIRHSTFSGSDGHSIKYNFFLKSPHKGHKDISYLYQVDKTNGPTENYEYEKKSNSKLYQIVTKKRPKERYLKIEYYKEGKNTSPNTKVDTTNDWLVDRVKNLYAPVGCDSKPINTHTFVYYAVHNNDKFCLGGITDVYNAYSVKNSYHYDHQQRLLILDKCNKAGKPYTSEFFVWGADTGPNWGNLIGTRLRDDCGRTIKAKRLEYDQHGNIIIESLFGNLTGSYTADMILDHTLLPIYCTGEAYSKWFKYSEDGLNLLVHSSEHNGKEVYYFYKPGTNLLTIKLEAEKGVINKRTFCDYDKNGSLTQKIIDDGSRYTKEDLSGVTERRITRYGLTSTIPIGLPERTEELYLDLATGQEVLMKRIDSLYSLDAKLIKQDVYGSDSVHAYTLLWDYNTHGKLRSHTNALGETINYEYDDNDNKTSEQDAAHITNFTYDYSNRLTKEVTTYWDGITQTTSHSYDYLHNRTSTVDPFGCETKYEYDEFCRKIKVIHPAVPNEAGQLVHPTESFTYDVLGNVASHTSSKGAVTATLYNIRNQPTLIVSPDSTLERFEYHTDGTLKFKISKNGTKTCYTYDSFGNVIVEEDFASSGESLRKTTALYSAFHLLSTTDAEGMLTTYSYDGAGQLIAVITGDQRTTYEYDSLGRVFKKYEWLSEDAARITISLYDNKDRMIEERIEDLNGNNFHKVQYQYDFYDNICLSEEGESITHYFVDGLNRPTKTIDALGNITQTVYNNAFINDYGQYIVQQKDTDPLGNQTITTYDTHHRVATITKNDPMGKLTFKQEFKYDKDGNECTTIDHVIIDGKDARQIITKREYDLSGQLTAQIEAQGTPEQKTTRYVYNKCGELEKLVKPNGVILTHIYDALGRLKQFKSSDNNIDYEYTYNKNDLVTQSLDKVHGMNTLREYDQGRMIQETLGHGVSIKYDYDAFGRISSLKVKGNQIDYQYDEQALKAVSWKGNKHEIVERNIKGLPIEVKLINGTIKTYSYDLLDRCVSIEHPAITQTATYDAIGNMLTKDINQESKKFSYDALSQLINEKDNNYDYDSLGNRLQHNDSTHQYNALNQIEGEGYIYDSTGNLIAGDGSIYFYDALDRLISVKNPTSTIEYRYDAFDRRLIRKVNDQEQHFIYQQQEEIGSIQNDSWVDFRVLDENNQAIALEQGGVTQAPLYDLTNNVIGLMDLHGAITEHYAYSAFKEESNLETWNPWRYAGKRTDPETGFVYFGKRYYSPSLGRWVTTDPLGYADGPNLYAYVHNNPLRYFDAQGLFGQDFSFNSFNNPRFQGSLQAFGGLSEAVIGGSMALGTGGLLAPLGGVVMAHGLDQCWAGLKTVYYGTPMNTATNQLLQGSGLSPQAAHYVDSGISIVGTLGGAAYLKAGQSACNLGSKVLASHASELGSFSPKFVNTTRKGSAIGANASINLSKKLSQLEKSQQMAVKTRILPDGRIRYYDLEAFSIKTGPTRGRCQVVEFNPYTGKTRSWSECYNHFGNVNRIHPKQINGQELTSPHYPPLRSEI